MTNPEAQPDHGQIRPTVRTAAAILAVAGAVVLVLVFVGGNSQGTSVRPAPSTHTQPSPSADPGQAQATVTIGSKAKMMNIPRSYLGFSTEYWTLPTDELHITLYRRILSLVHVPGDGPLVLRIGGDSSDHTFWDPNIRRLPHWAFELTPDFVERTARIVREMRLRVILDLNLVTGTPLEAGAWAHAAVTAMPNGSVIGFEIGNEPDLYDRELWLVNLGDTRFDAGLLPHALTPTTYAQDYLKYERVLAIVAPHVKLIAPALANPQLDSDWIKTLLADPHPNLGTISVHRYPYSACVGPSSPAYPTVKRLLSLAATVGMAQSVEPALKVAKKAGVPVRLTEINSITCGGLDGVSPTFSTALWAPDAVFQLVKEGVSAVNLHARVFAPNAPFRFSERGIIAHPLMYGLILFARTLGRDSRLVPVKLDGKSGLNLRAWAVRVGKNTLHMLLFDKGPKSVRLTLHLPASGPLTVERLLAPSAKSRTGVTFAGQHLGEDVKWKGRRVVQTVIRGPHGYEVTIRGISAALLSARVSRGALGSAG
jgi:hypothetical protein